MVTLTEVKDDVNIGGDSFQKLPLLFAGHAGHTMSRPRGPQTPSKNIHSSLVASEDSYLSSQMPPLSE